MHIVNNLCDNILGTLLDLDNKSKDTWKARLDLQKMVIREKLWLKPKGGKYEKPPAESLTPNDRKELLRFLRSLKLPDGYASNIARKVNIDTGKVSGLKSHDLHILLQRIIAIDIHRYLKKDVYTLIIQLSTLF